MRPSSLSRRASVPKSPTDDPPNRFSLANHPPWALADLDFQRHPRALHLGRTRADNRRLFALLDAEDDLARRGEIFHDYITVQFSLHEWDRQGSEIAGRCLRNSYLRFLQGWSFDSNSVAGAVIKSWVQSRFGLAPTFHHEPLENSWPAQERYLLECIRGQSRTSALFQQFDLLFEFSQYELVRRFPWASHHTLFRGSWHEQPEACMRPGDQDLQRVRFNSVCSFTADPETAWEFGLRVWETRVPRSKILFFSGLLPTSLLRGEDEFIVLGGEYQCRLLRL